ncbi:hypothetical protein [Clostridium tagluense]|uniref:Uncharacterized protein n=1 Tax=Clostridium tagluense TaxID=360422 RepID=A0A401ULN2_9CLOT|nr:hypothetical protein [Clostridium tagluense]GCD10440.1 hypothetical protein Ctaglu_20630 [Clostridium tagluense]
MIKNKDLKLRSMKAIFIDKDFPLCYPMSIFDFHENIEYLNVLAITIINLLQGLDKKDYDRSQYIKKNVKNFDVIMNSKSLIGMFVNLIKIQFKLPMKDIKVMKDDNGNNCYIMIQKKYFIHRDNYDKFRNYLIEINDIKFPKQVEDKELNEWFERARLAKSSKDNPTIGETLDLLCLETGIDYDTLMYGYSIYRVNRLIERYGAIQDFKSNIQYMCAGAEKIDLKSYLTHIDINKEEELSIKFDDFATKMGGIIQ